ncbi:MAG: DUF1156 domain-containing protein [Nitrobacter sp.]|uniref:DUF1156 domain-containing protein n=1 Tax=Nitrobacter sp. TaxID=29420 RepID=UPI00260329DC|nr:DUF1156 domain-containing protein [Nitrobacter sp.]MCV0386469.1 DUF1156 domain-containing protein [Nitrobacter sp.]
MTVTVRKKLIEVSIPLEAINKASAKEKSIRHGHPSTLHLWWARRPLAACRAVIFSQLVDDPSSWPDKFPTEEDQSRERERLHKVIEGMVSWEASNNEHILNGARWEIARSVAWGLGEEPPSKSNPAAVIAYLQEKAPPVYDPFCGGGSIPLEAQRLGLRAYGSDLNPVAVLISKALIEIPPKFSGQPPVNPKRDLHRRWKNSEGLADDVRYYGQWMRDEAEKRIGRFYPRAVLPDGKEATVIAWLWGRTVASPDPMAKGAHVPLVSSFMLSTKQGKQAWVDIVRDEAAPDGWKFEVSSGKLAKAEEEKKKLGTKSAKAQDFICALTGAPIPRSYIQAEGKARRLGVRLMAIVVDHARARSYLSPIREHEAIVEELHGNEAIAEARQTFLSGSTPTRAMITGGVCSAYGIATWGDFFTDRQILALTTLSDLVGEVRELVLSHARQNGVGGEGALLYADAVATYMSFLVSQCANHHSSNCGWNSVNQQMRSVFSRQGFPMVWDFADSNIFSKSSGSYSVLFDRLIKGFEALGVTSCPGSIEVSDAQLPFRVSNAIITTDPPYYDNIAYAVLSDFFYNWLRRSCADIWPGLFRRSQTQKDGELVATAHAHGGGDAAEAHFLEGMRKVMGNATHAASAQHPLSIYYAFKQSEATHVGLTSAGWSTFLQAIFDTGLILDGTWPVRTEKPGRTVGIGANALASSIVLVCRRRPALASVTTRREFVARLKREMPDALEMIKEAGVGPVDMAQSALGPGMGIFTSYAKVLEPDDSEMTVRTAIALINEVREEILGEEDAHYDPETRFCIDWFQAFGTGDGKSGDAIGMANAYNLGLADLEAAGVFYAKGGVARIVKRSDMPDDWHPSTDKRLTHWECAQHLIRVLDSEDGGGVAAAKLVAAMNPEDAEAARSLAYRLYDICEKKGWAQEAQAYNLLAEEFPHLELAALDCEGERGPAQAAFDLGGA